MPEFTKSYAINRIAELTEIGRSLDAENQQLEQKNKSLITQVSHYNKLLSEYGQDLQDTRIALRKACRCLTYYTNCFKLINNSAVVNELCGKFNSCTDCLFEYFLKKSKEKNANGD